LPGKNLNNPASGQPLPRRILFVLNEAYFFMSHRLALAQAVQAAGMEVHVAGPSDHVWAPSGFSTAEIEKQGFQFHEIPMSRRGVNPIVELRTFLALIFLYRKLRPDTVHHFTIKPNLYGGLAARIARVPMVIFSVTGLGHVFVGSGWFAVTRKTIVSALLKISMGNPRSRAIFQNPDDRHQLVAANIVKSESTWLILGSGVDVGEFTATPIPENGNPLVVFCARLIWEKGVGEFVEAARILKKDGIVARFALVGDTKPSNPRAVPRETLEAWDREKTVEWWGFCANMTDVLAQSQIVCLPSTYGEGIPKILLEAAASGRAIVTTNIAGCRESVADGISGFLVQPGNVSLLAAKLRTLIDDPGLAAQMGREGRKLAEEKFDVRQIVSATLKVYGELNS
jgi:glycosyltransferase involved in cell wall biosynthesis